MSEDESDSDSLVGLAFELQRDSIKLGQRTIERTLDARRAIDERLVGGVERQGEAQESALQFTQNTIDDLLETVGRTSGAEETVADLRESVDDGFDEIIERQGTLVEDIGERYDPDVRDVDPLDQAVLGALDDQLTFLLEANESIEAETVDAFERIIDEFEELRDVVSQETENVGEEFQAQVERFGDELEADLDEFEQRFEDRLDRVERLQDRVDDLRDDVEMDVQETADEPTVEGSTDDA